MSATYEDDGTDRDGVNIVLGSFAFILLALPVLLIGITVRLRRRTKPQKGG